MNLKSKIPAFIICRDRLTSTMRLVNWLEACPNVEGIVLIDNLSTYPPLLRYYQSLQHLVIFDGKNVPCSRRMPYIYDLGSKLFPEAEYFIVTDPDMEMAGVPSDLVLRCIEQLQRHPRVLAAGPSLEIEDLPSWYAHRLLVAEMESLHWVDTVMRDDDPWRLESPLADMREQKGYEPAYWAPIDSTFQVRRTADCDVNCERKENQVTRAFIRLGRPYTVRHTTWYLDLAKLPDDEKWYANHTEHRGWHTVEMNVDPSAWRPHKTFPQEMRERLMRIVEHTASKWQHRTEHEVVYLQWVRARLNEHLPEGTL